MAKEEGCVQRGCMRQRGKPVAAVRYSVDTSALIEAFRRAGEEIAEIERIAARRQGTHVDFVVIARGDWTRVPYAIESSVPDGDDDEATFDYRVVPAELATTDPAGYEPVYHR